MLRIIPITFSLFIFISCASAKNIFNANDPLERDTFLFREPSSNDISSKLTLWATYYYLPQINDRSGENVLRDMKNMELGPSLSLVDWCNSAMEGSVRVMEKNGEARTFNYAGITNENIVSCKKIFKIDVSKTKFRLASGPYGDGLDSYILSPYRTLATDQKKIIAGTALYIPQARGAKIVLKNGRVIIHDGYFFAADKGGAIKENHIDVFIGTHLNAPFFPWIKSNSAKTFEAYVISDQKIISELNDLHALK